MRDNCFLIVSEYGVERMTKRPPPLKGGEIAIAVTIDVPKELFIRPRVSAVVKVDPAAIPPVDIDAGTLEAISDHIRDGLGVNVDLRVLPEEAGD